MKNVFSRLICVATLLVVSLLVPQVSYAQRSGPLAPLAPDAIVLSETFDSSSLPADWVVYGDPTWRLDNPGNQSNNTGGAGNMVIADSNFAGAVPMEADLRTPTLDLSTATAVQLSFKTFFKAHATSIVDVAVRVDGGDWTTLWTVTGADYQGTVTLNVPEAAGHASVVFSFYYYDANDAWYWQVDDVVVETLSAPNAPSVLDATVAGSNVGVTWTDNGGGEANFIIERSPTGAGDWAEAGRVGANVTTFTHLAVPCGETVHYRAKATNGALQSGYSNTDVITMTACLPSVAGINQNFDAAQSLPLNWTVTRGTWDFTQANTTGGSGNAPYGKPVNSELRTPVFNMTGANAVLLSFKTNLKIYAGQSQPQDAYVDISQDAGTTWITVWDKTVAYKGVVTLDLSQWAANRSNLMVRFLTKLPYGGSFWQLDDVQIAAMPLPAVPTGLAATLTGLSDVVLGWSGSAGAKYTVERSADSGSTWTPIADLADGATTYVDTSVASFTAYQYQVRAYNAAGQSAYSAAAGVTTGDKTVRYVDVTISLYPTATLATPADRAKYEAVIGYFADAVYESSNGANRVRKVTFYRDAKNFDSVHIQWIPTCHPNANTGGYIRPGTGARVEMCDVFGTTQFLATVKGQQDAGGTIAHEWGHFYYGMYDEYKGSGTNYTSAQATDPGTSISIMTSQWSGFANLTRFNFSTPAQNFSLQSGQGRVYGADAWTVLARPKNQDPQNSAAANRPYWPELAAAKPTAGTIDIDLPDATARAALQIVWEPGFAPIMRGPNAVMAAPNNVIREVVIDRSALMADSGYLDAVKAAVAALIDQSVTSDTLGLIAFDGAATVVAPLTNITDQTTQDALVADLDGIAAGDADAAGGDALQAALTALTAPAVPTDTTRVVYYITARRHTTGTNPTTVMPGYQAAGIQLHIFGFDPLDGDEANLRLLADLTQGDYTTVQDTSDLQKALGLAKQTTSLEQDVTLAFDYELVEGGVPFTYTLSVDATLAELNFEFTYYGEALSATITLTDSNNTTFVLDPYADCDTYGSGADAETTCYIGFYPAPGNWTVALEAPEDIWFVDRETGIAPAGQTTYNPVITVIGGDVVAYPQPIVVEAAISRNYPIGGLGASGWLFAPDGSLVFVDFDDDGVAPDTTADDGIYSAYVDYTQNGEHWITVHFANHYGTGFYTDKGLMTTDPISLPVVTEDFERYAEVQVTVSGWQADDHANWPDDPNQPATALPLDNIPLHGRIDFENDDDVFEVTVPADYAEETLGIRLNRLGLGMDPYVVVYAADHSWRFVRYLENVATNNDTLFIPIAINKGETFYVEVWHFEIDQTGTYNISAGPHLWSDPIAKAKEPDAPITVVQTGLTEDTPILFDSIGVSITLTVSDATNLASRSITVTQSFIAPGGAWTTGEISATWYITHNLTTPFTATLSFCYTPDEIAELDESTLHIYRWTGSNWDDLSGGVDLVNHCITVSGIHQFSHWTLAGPSGPTAVALRGLAARGGVWIGGLGGVGALLGLTYFMVRRRRRS